MALGLDAVPQRPPLYVASPPLQPETGQPKIRKLLIANRGEIACRIIRTCKRLLIRTVAVYVEEDKKSLHITEADEAVNIGSIQKSSTNPFLNIDLLVKTALDTGSHAIHPGYGYLSENANFATRVNEAGLIFVGPKPDAMSTLGDKRSSKAYLAEHLPEVPLIPGFSGSSTQAADLEKAAEDIGFPVMLKASAGGGGKGMRIVRELSQLRDELVRVQSEASRSFGSNDCILEKYVENSKHVEIQILGDSFGNVVSLFERDCSIQRRHQKVVEESPCPFLSEELRRDMGNTAVQIAQLIGYGNAGTVEFVVDVETGKYFFLEVNARLQVEHPITEETTGVDLVALQLFVASGGNLKSLPPLQNLRQTGHAIECRLCAEDPQNGFFPEHGKILLWRPADGALRPGRDVRYETAMQTDSSVSIYFDSMIAKIVVWAPTRALAIQKSAQVLAETACVGVKTNQLFLQRCLLHSGFQVPGYNTSFIPRHESSLLAPLDFQALKNAHYALPSVFIRRMPQQHDQQARPFRHVRPQFRNQRHDLVNVHADVIQPDSQTMKELELPVPSLCLWEPAPMDTSQRGQRLSVISIPAKDSPEAGAIVQYQAISAILRDTSSWSPLALDFELLRWHRHGTPLSADGSTAATIDMSVNGFKLTAHCIITSQQSRSLNESQPVYVHFPLLGTWVCFRRSSILSYAEDCRSTAQSAEDLSQNSTVAPMPCKILAVQKESGDQVVKGEVVMVIESMKMEVSIKANGDGEFSSLWKPGDAVDEGKILFELH